MARWVENTALFTEGKPNSNIAKSFAFAKRELSNLPNFLNPKDTLLSHSIRVAGKIHELINNPLRQNTLESAALLLEIPQAKGLGINDVLKGEDYDIWFPIFCYSSKTKKYPDYSNIKDILEQRIQYSKVIGTSEQLQRDILFVFLVNELDFLNSQLDFYNDLVQMFGDNGKEIFLGSLPYSFRDHVWVHERLIQEVNGLEQSDTLPYKEILTEYRSHLEFFRSIAPDLLEEPKDIRIWKDSLALKFQSKKILENSLTAETSEGLYVSMGGNVALEKGVKFEGQNKIVGDIDINLYSLNNPSVNINENEQKLLADKLLESLFEHCYKNGLDWEGSLKLSSFERRKKNLLQELKVVSLEDFANTYDFQLEEIEKTFQRFTSFTVAIGDYPNTLIMTPLRVELAEKETPLFAAQNIDFSKFKNPKHDLLVDTHLFLPYVFPEVVKLLKQVGLYSRQGLEVLSIAALDNKDAWINIDIEKHIYNNTPKGIFSSQEESIDFLKYLADTFRESLGKTVKTEQLLGSKDYIKEFIKLYQADEQLQMEILNSLGKWYRDNPHSIRGDEKEKKRINKLIYYDKLIESVFK